MDKLGSDMFKIMEDFIEYKVTSVEAKKRFRILFGDEKIRCKQCKALILVKEPMQNCCHNCGIDIK